MVEWQNILQMAVRDGRGVLLGWNEREIHTAGFVGENPTSPTIL
jgi:hypothetical protein